MAVSRARRPRERSEITHLFTDEDAGPPYTVFVDVHLTRRKWHHIVTDSQGGVTFRSRRFADIIEWLASRGEKSYTIDTGRDCYALTAETQR